MEHTRKVPALRFPEFEGDWEIKKLKDIGKFIGGGTPSTQNQNFWNGNIPWVSSSDLTDESIYQINATRFINDNAIKLSATKLVPKNSILIVSRVGVGKVAVNEVDLCTSQDFTNVFLNVDNYIFIAYLLKIKTTKLLGFNQGTSIKGFVKSDLEVLELNIPTLSEQQKIADFLVQIDNKIEKLTKKKKLLERYKKGVMQKIFSQEIRFKDNKGNDYPDWKTKKFGEIFSFRTTNSFSRENLNYDNGSVKNIHYGDVHTSFSTLFNVSKEVVPLINSKIELGRISKDNYCKIGDLVIADASEDYEDVGKCIEIINLNNEKVLSGLHTILARPDLYKMHVGFSGYLMKSNNVRLQIKIMAQGSKVLSISSKRLSEINLIIPEITEQQKITDFLTEIDSKIRHVSKQLEGTKQYKKGLLQKMFI